MRIIKARYNILKYPTLQDLKLMEYIGRGSTQSWDNTTADSWKEFIKNRITEKHKSVIEQADVIVEFFTDIGVGREIRTHRLTSPLQESTRYCNYSKKRFKNSITCIDASPFFMNPASFDIWFASLSHSERAYFALIENGEKPEIARGVLPLALKAWISVKGNVSEWKHIFTMRTGKDVHPQMREVMIPLLKELQSLVPVVFDDLEVKK